MSTPTTARNIPVRWRAAEVRALIWLVGVVVGVVLAACVGLLVLEWVARLVVNY